MTISGIFPVPKERNRARQDNNINGWLGTGAIGKVLGQSSISKYSWSKDFYPGMGSM